MHIDFLLEEYSAEVALKNILPKLLSENVSYGLHSYEGKYDMLKKLADRLNGYSHWLPSCYKVMVLIDEDRKDCHEIKAQLEGIAQEAGLITKTNAINNECFQVVNRIAIEELEAWFFGDIEAIHKAYPKIPTNLQTKKAFQNPDAIAGGTFETLEKLLKQKKYYDQDLRKITKCVILIDYENIYTF